MAVYDCKKVGWRPSGEMPMEMVQAYTRVFAKMTTKGPNAKRGPMTVDQLLAKLLRKFSAQGKRWAVNKLEEYVARISHANELKNRPPSSADLAHIEQVKRDAQEFAKKYASANSKEEDDDNTDS